MISHGTVEQLPYEAESFDQVVTINSINFWTDIRRGISEVLRVLRPGGRFINVENFYAEMSEINPKGVENLKKSEIWHLYSLQEFQDLHEQAGFIGVSITQRDTPSHPTWTHLRITGRKPS